MEDVLGEFVFAQAIVAPRFHIGDLSLSHVHRFHALRHYTILFEEI